MVHLSSTEQYTLSIDYRISYIIMQYFQKKIHNTPQSVVIIGGGFAGVRCALDLAKKSSGEISITLVSQGPALIYYPAMYRYVTGAPEQQVAIPLHQIFKKYPHVTITQDTITAIDADAKEATGASGLLYTADAMVIAVGSENNYFQIEGVDEISYNFKSFEAARILRDRIHALFMQHAQSETEELLLALHFMIIGGGASGVELAGELAVYAAELARLHELPESLVTIDIVERNDRLMSRMDPKVSHKIEQRLKKLGVHLLLNRSMIKNDSWTVFLRDMTIGAKTVVWTAGVKCADISQNIPGCTYTERGKVVVTEHLETQEGSGVFAVGDIAETQYSGLAQAAISDGAHAARVILADFNNQKRPTPSVKEPWHVIPIGPGWGALQYHGIKLFGVLAWGARFLADIRYYLSILSVWEVFKILSNKRVPAHDATVPLEKNNL